MQLLQTNLNKNIKLFYHPSIFLEYWPFGYEKSDADVEWMLDFLLFHYPYAYIIDGKRKQLELVERKTLNNFTQERGEKEGQRNLFFCTAMG